MSCSGPSLGTGSDGSLRHLPPRNPGPFVHPLDRVERRLRSCVWDLTRLCNLRCVHCENRCGPRHPDELSLAQMLDVVDSLARLGCQSVDVTGGEPLAFAGWYDVTRRLRQRGIKVVLVTNGMLLDERRVEMVVQAGVGLVVVSVDGLAKTHDRTRLRVGPGPSPFEKAIEGLLRVKQRLPVAVLTQVNRHNLDELPALHEQLEGWGVPRWQLQLAIPAGRLLDYEEPYVLSPDQLPQLVDFLARTKRAGGSVRIEVSDTIGYYSAEEPTLRNRSGADGLWMGCGAGIRVCAITYDGRVRGCSMMPEEFDAGSLHEESLEAIWNDRSRFGFSLDYQCSQMTGTCGRCRYRTLCRGGCTTMAYRTTGSIYENPMCLHALRVAKGGRP